MRMFALIFLLLSYLTSLVAYSFLEVVLQNCRAPLRNEAEAVKWYTKASKLGEVKSSVNLGVMFAEGKGPPLSLSDAFFCIIFVIFPMLGYCIVCCFFC
jgi:hypothetical protein